MLKPLIAIFSQKPRYAAELPQCLRQSCEFLVCDSVAEVEELLASRRPRIFVADFEQLISSGHIEDQLLAELQKEHPLMQIFMITQPDCREPLLSRGQEDNVIHVNSGPDIETLAQSIRELIDQPAEVASEIGEDDETPADSETSVPKPPRVVDQSRKFEDQPDTVLAGMTRRFETNTPELKQMLRDLEVAAKHNVTILLIGETGCGKTFLSRLIHEVSPRRDEPFLHVACGALPQHLLESELFGHVKGSFTSAHADKEGKFLAAGRGTVLLDEIDVLGPEQQVKLLKVIETGEFEPVGSNQTYTSQARLVVASNLELQPLVESGKFRPDLYYRLNMLKFELLPLRKRRPDINTLAQKFVSQMCAKHGVNIERIDQSLFDALHGYPWPGNVRELENVIQRAIIYCTDGELRADHLPAHIVAGQAGPTNDPSVSLSGLRPAQQAPEDRPTDLSGQIETTEKEIIEHTLYKNNFSRTNTARELGISRVTLYNKMKKYGMVK